MSGLLGLKGPSASTQALNGIRLQTSLYGLPIPIVYGKARLSGNVIHMPDAPKTVKGSSGKLRAGKIDIGASGGQNQIAPIAIMLCEGPIAGIGLVWVTSPPGQDFATKIQPAGWTLFDGHAGQGAWPYLHSNHPDQELTYPATAYVANPALGLSGGVADNYSWEVKGFLPFSGLIPDALPTAVIVDLLTDPTHGLGWDPTKIGDTTLVTAYVQAFGLFVSPVMDAQQPASSYLQELLAVANSTIVWSDGVLKIVPYGDTAFSGNSATYTPNTTPIYDLTDNDFLAGDGEDPVHVVRATNTERYNQLYVEFQDRINDYNTSVAEAKIEDDIILNGLKPAPKITLNSIKDAGIARHVAQLTLQRLFGIRNTYQFKLGWRYSLLEPMDLVTLTDAGLGLSLTPVRITEIVEAADEQGFEVTAEEWPFGTATATKYATQGAQGLAAAENVDPGSTFAPVIFEGPYPTPSSSLELWLAASGGAEWGGCDVYVSTDNAQFYRIGQIVGRASYGVTTAGLATAAPLPAIDTTHTLSVDLTTSGGALDSGVASDVPALLTLCYLGSEYLSYETATLTSAEHYDLTTLGRGGFASIIPASHAIGSAFVRCDQGLLRFPFPQGLDGQVVYFKFPAFNIYGKALQDVSVATSYSHTISLAGAPPPSGAGPSLEVTPVATATQVTFSYTKIGTLTLFKNDVSITVPASPFTVNRPAANAPDDVYSFVSALNGETTSDNITVSSKGDIPDLAITPGSSDLTSVTVTISASNRGGGTAPTISMTLIDGVTATGFTGAGPFSLSSPTTVTFQRPGFGAGSPGALIEADIAGGGSESEFLPIPQVSSDTVPFRIALQKLSYNATSGIYEMWIRVYSHTLLGVETEEHSAGFWSSPGTTAHVYAVSIVDDTGATASGFAGPSSTDSYNPSTDVGWHFQWTSTNAQAWSVALVIAVGAFPTPPALFILPALSTNGSLNLTIPKAAGASTTVAAGSTTTGAPGTSASVTNTGTSSAAVFAFTIPAGSTWRSGSGAPSSSLGVNGDFYLNTATSDVYQKASGAYSIVVNIKGATGTPGSSGTSATVAVGTTTTGSAGSSASVTNSGSSSAAVLNFTIPRGADGATGPAYPITISTGTPTGTPIDGQLWFQI